MKNANRQKGNGAKVFKNIFYDASRENTSKKKKKKADLMNSMKERTEARRYGTACNEKTCNITSNK